MANASAAGTGKGSRGRGAGGELDWRAKATPGGDRTTARRMPLRRVSERGVSPPAPSQAIIAYPVDGDCSNGGY
jgi:hypothetical protein